MAYYFSQESRTFSEYLLVPNLTAKDCTPDRVNLATSLVRFRKGEEESPVRINLPVTSAIMQAVSDDQMAIALARLGGLSFVYGSQSIESQTSMIGRVKKYKAGIVTSDSNLTPDATLAELLQLKQKTGHSTVAVTHDGTPNGFLAGIVTSKDYRISRTAPETPVREFMTPFDKLVIGRDGISLSEANDLIWDHKVNQLPIVTEDGRLIGMVFRKDYDEHKENPSELMDAHKRLMVGAASTPATSDSCSARSKAGRMLCIASDGSVWQSRRWSM